MLFVFGFANDYRSPFKNKLIMLVLKNDTREDLKLFFKDPIFASLVGAAAPSKAFQGVLARPQ